MKVVFSSHAIGRMQERSISRELVAGSIRNSDKVERSLVDPSRFLIKKLYYSQKFQKDHLLMIICEIQAKIIKVITIIDTSKISKYF